MVLGQQNRAPAGQCVFQSPAGAVPLFPKSGDCSWGGVRSASKSRSLRIVPGWSIAATDVFVPWTMCVAEFPEADRETVPVCIWGRLGSRIRG